MLKLLQVIEKNRVLVSLNLSYNFLLEEQPLKLLKPEDEAADDVEV